MKNSNKFLSLLFVLLGLFILIIFTKSQIFNLQANLDLKAGLKSTYSEKETELSRLNALKKSLEGGQNAEIEKYLINFKEDELVEYLYGYAESINGSSGFMVIKSVSFNEGDINEYGFKEGFIGLDVRVSDEDTMVNLLNFLTGPDSKYQFFIESFSYAPPAEGGSFSINIPLKVFYK